VQNLRAILNAASRQLSTPRDKTFLVVVATLSDLTYDQLTSLTITDARAQVTERLKTHPLAKTALALINRTTEDADQGAYLFPSRKGRGSRPATRQTAWRILQKATGGGLRHLRRLLAPRTPPSTPVNQPAAPQRTQGVKDSWDLWRARTRRRRPPD
jgi:hypothetical protein